MQSEFDQGPPGPGRRESIFHVGTASRAVARPDRGALTAAEDVGRQAAQGGGPDGTRGGSQRLDAMYLYSIALRSKWLWDIYDAVYGCIGFVIQTTQTSRGFAKLEHDVGVGHGRVFIPHFVRGDIARCRLISSGNSQDIGGT